jgi:hypothetical protein
MPRTEMTVVPTAQANLEGDPVINRDNPYLVKSMTLSKNHVPTGKKSKEPQMKALCRILGINIRELIPAELCDAIDQVYAYNQIQKDTFQSTPFETEADKEDFLYLARAYAETAGEKGYTIFTKTVEEPEICVWKVTDRRGTKGTSGE